jgi:hypothetical protein
MQFILLPPTKPSPATKDSATASTPWKPSTTYTKDGTIEWSTISIRWSHPRRRRKRCLKAISVWTIAPIRHRTESSTSTSHRAHSSWSSSIKSWHRKHLLSREKITCSCHGSRVRDPFPTIAIPKVSLGSFKMTGSTSLIPLASSRSGSVVL